MFKPPKKEIGVYKASSLPMHLNGVIDLNFQFYFIVMSIIASDVAEFAREDDADRKLGDVIAGRFSGLDVDSVESVRELRERR